MATIAAFFLILLASPFAMGQTPPESSSHACGGNSGGDPLYEVNTHNALTHVALTNQLATIHEYLKDELLFAEGLIRYAQAADGASRTLLNWAREGSEREDDGTRWRHHFHDPIADQGLNGVWPFNGQSAVVWATHASVAINEWALPPTMDRFRRSLTDIDPYWRGVYLADAFRGIGHFMHLIEDMAQPSHSRNDPHALYHPLEAYASDKFGSFAYLVWQSGAQLPSPSTEGLRKLHWHNYATQMPDEIPYFTLEESLPDFSCVALGVSLPGGRYRRWFDTDQYPPPPPQTAATFSGFTCSPGLAEFSNFNFFSEDRIFQSGANNYPRPTYSDTNWATTGLPIPGGNVILMPDGRDNQVMEQTIRRTSPGAPGTVGVDVGQALCRVAQEQGSQIRQNVAAGVQPSGWIYATVNDPIVLESYCQHLLPKAIAYCTDFANYLFRGRFSVNLAGNPQAGKLELSITNSGPGTLTAGDWWLLQDDGVERRSVDANFAAYPGSLANGQSFTVQFDPTDYTGQYTLVFKAYGAPEDDYTIEVVAKSFEEPVGACCVNGTCSVRVQQECDALGGTFLGEDTTCDQGCPGACCLPNGTCVSNVAQSTCTQQGGTPLGGGSTCGPNPCSQSSESGACCLPNGSCAANLTSSACQQQNGWWRGPGTTCTTSCNSQTEVPHGCCLPGGDCEMLPITLCQSVGGVPSGGNCQQASCACCPQTTPPTCNDTYTCHVPSASYTGCFGCSITISATPVVLTRTPSGNYYGQTQASVTGSCSGGFQMPDYVNIEVDVVCDSGDSWFLAVNIDTHCTNSSCCCCASTYFLSMPASPTPVGTYNLDIGKPTVAYCQFCGTISNVTID